MKAMQRNAGWVPRATGLIPAIGLAIAWVLLMGCPAAQAQHHHHHEHTLTVGYGSGDGDYAEGTWVTITADPPPSGKVFDRWRGENGPCWNRFASTTAYRMPDEDAEVYASYMDPPAYTLDVDFGSGDGSYAAGTVITIVADPPPAGKVFSRWRDDHDYCADRYASSTPYTMPDRNCHVYAYYEDAPPGPPGTTTTTTSTSTTTTTTPTSPTTTTTTTIPYVDPEEEEGQERQYSIIAVGTVRGRTRTITLEGIYKKTWAKYALWMNNNQSIYFKSGEKFYGHVHSNDKMWFSGNPEFFSDCTTAASTFGGSTNAVIFHKGFEMNQPVESMGTVNFADLKLKSRLIVTGATQVAISGTNVLVTNSRQGWNGYLIPLTNELVMYVASTTGGSNPNGDVSVAGTLDGRLTIVSDRDISITNHLKYVSDPKTNAAADDALGLIAKGDIIVKPSCPNDLNVYAHMLATGQDSSRDGSFGVENYSSGSPRGQLVMHGGIGQNVRGAVGTFNAGTGQTVTGYEKNYTYDTRFAVDPPPEYPPLGNELTFGNWRDKK